MWMFLPAFQRQGAPGWLSWLSNGLDFGSGQDLGVGEFKPCMGLSTDSTEPVWDSLSLPLSLSLSAPPWLTCALSQNN